jgi:hypothetical protein
LILTSTDTLHTWSKADIVAHTQYINKQIKAIVEYLKPTL